MNKVIYPTSTIRIIQSLNVYLTNIPLEEMSVTYGSDSEKCIKPARFVVSLLTPLLPREIKKKFVPIISIYYPGNR